MDRIDSGLLGGGDLSISLWNSVKGYVGNSVLVHVGMSLSEFGQSFYVLRYRRGVS